MSAAAPPAAPIVLAHLVAVLYTTGFVWTLQLMDYPMVAALPDEASTAYMNLHNQMFWRVLAPGLLVGAVTTLLLLVLRPGTVPLWAPVLALILLVLVLVLSGAVATPDRMELARHFSETTHAHLISVSWVRTSAFTAWSALATWMTWRLIR